jgi:3-oxoacyl-(acyl-carrier-protein) synthase
VTSRRHFEPIVITGIGLTASVGADRESVWQAVREGRSGVRRMDEAFQREFGVKIAAPVDCEPESPGQIKNTTLCLRTAREAFADANVDLSAIDLDRFGCAISGHMGDTGGARYSDGSAQWRHDALPPWWKQWFPNTSCVAVANHFGLYGPRISHSTACASGLIDVMAAADRIRDDQCDIALAGSSEVIHPLFAAGFQAMRVLAHHDDPAQAARPFDRNRNGFVMGEGAAMFVLERLSHAQARGARIYAELAGYRMMSEGHHITSLDVESHGLAHLIETTLRDAEVAPHEVQYINAHGTGTHQNDIVESRGIRHALGPAADRTLVSSTKSMLGHLINAAGSVELAITTLALRDGFAPPTMNLTDPDPEVGLDCIPLVGRANKMSNALKISVAFGGHMAAVALRRWHDAASDYGDPRPRIAA